MYDQVIKSTREEIIRLIEQQQKLVRGLLEIPGLIQTNEEDQLRNLSQTELELWENTLNEESYKVKRLEMTLAVVGTMKAGKSTTINAIVGTEVLPNRELPMTTLPTRISHTPGQQDPKLYFPKPEPFNEAIEALEAELLNRVKQDQLHSIKTYHSEDGKALVESIAQGTFTYIQKAYNGTDEIYQFLKKLNDISRLCEELDLESPLIEYDSVEEFPIIQVEYFHLKHSDQSQGRFTMIDTPGPNEAGATYLKGILKEQIAKASAVMAVMDYTQLNGEADAEIRESLQEVVEQSEDRLYILVNKFDQRTKNSMGEASLKKYVANHLFAGKISTERILPVSSKYAYLSNRALNELERSGSLSNFEENDWIADFGDLALGRRWERRIEDMDEVKESAQFLWEDSFFGKPLEQVITRAASKAALISISSAVDKMLNYDNKIVESLGLRENALRINIQELKGHIENIKDDVDRIKTVNEEAQKLAKKSLKSIESDLNKLFNMTREELNNRIEDFFATGKMQERVKKQQKQQVEQQSQGGVLSGLFAALSGTNVNTPKKLDFDPNAPNEFDEEAEAKRFVKDLYSVVEKLNDKYSKEAQKYLNKTIASMQQDLWVQIENKVSSTLNEAKERMNDTFDLKLSFPTPTVGAFHIDFGQMEKNAVRHSREERQGTRYVRKWYTLWLMEHEESYTYHEDVYRVDTRKLNQQMLKQLANRYKAIQKEINSYVNERLAAEVDHYFEGLMEYLERFRGDLLDALKNQQLQEDELENLVQAMQHARQSSNEHIKDCHIVKEGIQDLQPEEKVLAE